MKAVFIINNATIDREVGELLQSLGLRAYTKIPLAYGAGETSPPRLGDRVWPGSNCIRVVVVEDEAEACLMKAISELRERFASEGLRAFSVPVTSFTD